jgi:hypothetical protein
MDPLSISLACISLLGAVSQTSTVVTNFVHDVRGVKDEINGVSQELQSLNAVLEILAGDAGELTWGRLPDTLERQIVGIVTNCISVVAEIERTLNRHDGLRLAKYRWLLHSIATYSFLPSISKRYDYSFGFSPSFALFCIFNSITL